jgi:hypothetical protein
MGTVSDGYRVEDYYSKMEPRGAILMVCDDLTAALGQKTNGDA